VVADAPVDKPPRLKAAASCFGALAFWIALSRAPAAYMPSIRMDTSGTTAKDRKSLISTRLDKFHKVNDTIPYLEVYMNVNVKNSYTGLVMGLVFELTLIGCVSIPEAKPGNDTLVVGRFNLIRNLSQNKQINGTFSAGIRLTFRSVADDRLIKINTQADGWFFLSNIQEGIYELTELYYVRESGNIKYIFEERIESCFVVKQGKANNVGIINLVYEDREQRFENSQEYDAVRDEFSVRYDQSNWNDQEWVNTNLSLEYRTISDYLFIHEETVMSDDPTRFYWLWICWNNMAGQQVKAYPVPEEGMTTKDWVQSNLERVPATKLITFPFSMTLDQESPNDIPFVVHETAQSVGSFMLFFYKQVIQVPPDMEMSMLELIGLSELTMLDPIMVGW
jgi:hypothetical protein